MTDQDIQDILFQDQVPLTDEQLAAVLKDSAYVSEEGVSGPAAFQGWDADKTNADDNGSDG